MSTGKRLWLYALHYKKLLILGISLLTVGVAADLAGPLIAKKIIDDHIAVGAGNGSNINSIVCAVIYHYAGKPRSSYIGRQRYVAFFYCIMIGIAH